MTQHEWRKPCIDWERKNMATIEPRLILKCASLRCHSELIFKSSNFTPEWPQCENERGLVEIETNCGYPVLTIDDAVKLRGYLELMIRIRMQEEHMESQYCECHCHNDEDGRLAARGIICRCIKNCVHCHPENYTRTQ